MTQITDGCLEVENGSGCAARVDSLALLNAVFLVVPGSDDCGIAATGARDYQYIPFLEGSPACITSLGLTSGRSHITTDVSAQENGGLLCGAFGHIDIQELIGRVLDVGHKIESLIGSVPHAGAIVHGHHARLAGDRVKLQCGLWCFNLGRCAHC